jgi:hypothetical protein
LPPSDENLLCGAIGESRSRHDGRLVAPPEIIIAGVVVGAPAGLYAGYHVVKDVRDAAEQKRKRKREIECENEDDQLR